MRAAPKPRRSQSRFGETPAEQSAATKISRRRVSFAVILLYLSPVGKPFGFCREHVVPSVPQGSLDWPARHARHLRSG